MKKIAPYVSREDVRGKLTGLMNTGTWEEFNYMETRAGQVRGNHYHKNTRELFYIIEGDIDVVVQFPEQDEIKVVLHAGDLIEIEAMENHTFYCRTDTKWINFLSKRFDPDQPDFHVLGK